MKGIRKLQRWLRIKLGMGWPIEAGRLLHPDAVREPAKSLRVAQGQTRTLVC